MSQDEYHITLRDNTMERERIKRTVVSVNVPDYYIYQREELGKDANSKVSDNTIFNDLKVKISVVSVCHSIHTGFSCYQYHDLFKLVHLRTPLSPAQVPSILPATCSNLLIM